MTLRKIRVCGFGLLGVLAYTASSFAQAAPVAEPAPASAPPAVATPAPAAPAADPVAPPTTTVATTTTTTVQTTTELSPAALTPPPAGYVAPKIESPNATIKLGLLAQPQFEGIGSPVQGVDKGSYNLFVRRVRLLVGGTLFKNFEYFFDTDAPNLFKAGANGAKGGQQIGVQDVFLTYKAYEDYFKVDVGYMLPPLAHNAVQGAGTLYTLDYFGNSFRHAGAFNSPGDVGRDMGVQFRGLLADNHLEYRAGIFQGRRQPGAGNRAPSRNMFRLAARVQFNVFDAETGFFYAGTYLGKKRILSFGASYDFQNSYKHWSLDGFLDMPVGPGGLTAQVNVVKWNGDDFLVEPVPPAMAAPLPNQMAEMVEAGYRFDDFPINPMVRYEYRKNLDLPAAAKVSESRYGLGAAYWAFGHNINLKALYTRIVPTNAAAPAAAAPRGYNQFNLQWQLYFY